MKKYWFILIFLVALVGVTDANLAKSRILEFDYQVYLKDIPEDASMVRIWLPVLPQKDYQIVKEMTVEPEGSYTINEDKTFKNKIINFALTPPFDSAFQINVHYKVKRYEHSKMVDGKTFHNTKNSHSEEFAKFLRASRLVTLSPQIKSLANQIVEGKETTIEKARAIYDYVYDNVSYDKSIAGWGQGDTERVCYLKAGNCTDFHSLFLSLSRASNIPAKFIMGVPLIDDKEEHSKYHCWAEFYDSGVGWVPVDISEAKKNNLKYEYHFGSIDERRVEFSEGRDIILEPKQAGDPLNYFIYPYVEVDGQVHKGVGVLFKYKNVNSNQGKEKVSLITSRKEGES